jgi:hypothetical protein
VPLKTYLPDGDIDIGEAEVLRGVGVDVLVPICKGACVLPRLASSFFVRIKNQLAKEASNPHAELPVHSITLIHAEVIERCRSFCASIVHSRARSLAAGQNRQMPDQQYPDRYLSQHHECVAHLAQPEC